MCLVVRVNMIYDYKLTIDVTKKEYEALGDYLFKYHGMKPAIHKKGDTAIIYCHGYGLEEKAKNKELLHKALHDFRVFSFKEGLI